MARFYVWTGSQDCAQNKLFLALLNGTVNQTVTVEDLRLVNSDSTATGVFVEFDLLKITAITAGTDITPTPTDSGDGAAASLTCVKAPTSVTGSTVFFSHFTNNDEVGATNAFPSSEILAGRNLLATPIICRNGAGIALKQITSSTEGAFAVVAVINIEQV